jgi:hypothetical protein
LIWEDNRAFVEAHNSVSSQGYTLALNEFANMSFDEFKDIYLDSTITTTNTNHSQFLSPLKAAEPPTTVDWTTAGYVTAVKDQVKGQYLKIGFL